MFWKTLILPLALMAGLLAPRANAGEEIHLGKIVSVMANVLVIANDDGTVQQTFTVPTTATVNLNGMPSKLEDMTQGDFVQVVTETKDGATVVTKIEAKSGEEKEPVG